MISFPIAPENATPSELSIKTIVRVINNIMRGKTNNRGEVTLAAASTTTVVQNVNAGGESIILFMPLTANAAAQLSTMFVSSQGKETFTITHTNNAQTDREFRFVIVG